MRTYVAGPLGFSEAGRAFQYEALIPALQRAGLEILDPWALTDPARIAQALAQPTFEARQAAWRRLNPVIAGANVEAIDGCDLVLAVLDGVDVDSGTAAEIGYAYARGKRILGYRGDLRRVGENEGAMVNLQVQHFIEASGGEIVTSLAELTKRIEAHLRG